MSDAACSMQYLVSCSQAASRIMIAWVPYRTAHSKAATPGSDHRWYNLTEAKCGFSKQILDPSEKVMTIHQKKRAICLTYIRRNVTMSSSTCMLTRCLEELQQQHVLPIPRGTNRAHPFWAKTRSCWWDLLPSKVYQLQSRPHQRQWFAELSPWPANSSRIRGVKAAKRMERWNPKNKKRLKCIVFKQTCDQSINQSIHPSIDRPNKQTNKQTNKQPNNQTNKPTNEQTNKHTCVHACICAYTMNLYLPPSG